MVVISVEEKVASKQGSDQIGPAERFGGPLDIQFGYDRTLVIVVSSPSDDENTVLSDPRVPLLGTGLSLGRSRDARVFCLKRTPSQIGPTAWEVGLRYGPLGADPKEPDDPLKKPPTVNWGSQSRLWYPPSQIDADGVLIANSAGDPFIPTLPRELNDLTLSVGRAEAGLNIKAITRTLGKINRLPWAGFKKEVVKFAGFSANRHWHEGRPHWQVTYSFLIRGMGWGVRMLDKGKRFHLVGTAGSPVGALVAATDGNGVITGEEVLLANGFQKPPDAAPQLLDFQMHEKADFAAIGFPWENN